MDEPKNPFTVIDGGKEDDTIPTNDYVVTDIDNDIFTASGFLVFTPHHLAIMRDEGKGAVPVLVLPISRVKAAELFDEDIHGEDDEAPF